MRELITVQVGQCGNQSKSLDFFTISVLQLAMNFGNSSAMSMLSIRMEHAII